MRKFVRALIVMALFAVGLQSSAGASGGGEAIEITPFRVDEQAMCDVTKQWTRELVAEHEPGTWAQMKFEPTNAQLARLGLPSKEILTSRRYPTPTLVTRDAVSSTSRPRLWRPR